MAVSLLINVYEIFKTAPDKLYLKKTVYESSMPLLTV